MKAKRVEKNIFIADDGTEFESVWQCKHYEENERIQKTFEGIEKKAFYFPFPADQVLFCKPKNSDELEAIWRTLNAFIGSFNNDHHGRQYRDLAPNQWYLFLAKKGEPDYDGYTDYEVLVYSHNWLTNCFGDTFEWLKELE